MTTLFRPWTSSSGKDKSAVDEMTILSPNKVEDFSSPDAKTEEDSRENKFQSIKEHMRKRSEKYMMKRLKMNSDRITTGIKREEDVIRKERETRNSYEFNPAMSYANCCVPIDGNLNGFSSGVECLIPGQNVTVCGNAIPGYVPESLEYALGQGFQTGFFEEYARIFTEQQRQVAERSRKQRPKKFRCPHCHVGFSNNGQLKGHIRIHTGERPFKCDAESCGKSFTRNEELTRHRRIHSGLRPFPCSECGKRFGRKDHLKKHIKTHFQQRYQLVPVLPSHCPYYYTIG